MPFEVLRQVFAKDFLEKQQEKLPSVMASTKLRSLQSNSLVENLKEMQTQRERRSRMMQAGSDFFDIVEKAGQLPEPSDEELDTAEKELKVTNPDQWKTIVNTRRLLRGTNIPETLFSIGDEQIRSALTQFYPELAAPSSGVQIAKIQAESKVQNAIDQMALIKERGRQQRITNWTRISQESARDQYQAELDNWIDLAEKQAPTFDQKLQIMLNLDKLTDEFLDARGWGGIFGWKKDEDRAELEAELDEARKAGDINKYVDIINSAVADMPEKPPERPPELGGSDTKQTQVQQDFSGKIVQTKEGKIVGDVPTQIKDNSVYVDGTKLPVPVEAWLGSTNEEKMDYLRKYFPELLGQ